MTTTTTSLGSRQLGRAPGHLRGDIEGLRALAILLVLLYHAGLTVLPGGFVGVDVFFVISGFLITQLLLREVAATGGISLRRFWARRARRLLPASVLVLVVTAVATWLLLPVTRWREIGGDVAAAAAYLVNWRFADRSIDYLASDSEPSPLLHFWSLAVEEQFYLLWPVLLVAIIYVCRRRGVLPSAPLVGSVLALVAVASLGWAVHLSFQGTPTAFFVTTTRAWELAIGASVALALPLCARIPRRAAPLIGAAGFAAIVCSAVVFTSDSVWPGLLTLVPTIGTAAIIASGVSNQDSWLTRLLGVRPVGWLGGVSYSLYLWHWPVIVIGSYVVDDNTLTTGLSLAAASLIPAMLSYYLVENPIRFSRQLKDRNTLTLLLGGAVSVATIGLGLWLSVAATGVATTSSPDGPQGAQSLISEDGRRAASAPLSTYASITPSLANAADDIPDMYADGCHAAPEEDRLLKCTYGNPGSKFVVALVGDSHAAQWQPALEMIAIDRGWRLDTYTKSGCFFGDVDVWYETVNRPYASCSAWNDLVIHAFEVAPPDLIITSTSGSYSVAMPDGSRITDAAAAPYLVQGMARTWSRLAELSTLAVVLDTPRPNLDVPLCLAENPDKAQLCAVSRQAAEADSGAAIQRAAAGLSSPDLVADLSADICPGASCTPVIGSVLVWRDTNHLTATYVRSLAPALEKQIAPPAR